MSSKTWLRAGAVAVLSLSLSTTIAVAQNHGHGHDKHDREHPHARALSWVLIWVFSLLKHRTVQIQQPASDGAEAAFARSPIPGGVHMVQSLR